MAELSKNWITEKVVDFEYKKYLLLAYLQEVAKHFEAVKLYPHLSELVGHHRQALLIRENLHYLEQLFPHKLKKLDMENLRTVYEKIIEDDSLMEEIESIVNFSIPQFEKHLMEGKKIFDFVEEHTHIFPVGVIPLNNNEGYLFICERKSNRTNVYEYSITIFEQPEERYRGIHTSFIKSFSKSFSTSYESIKTDLIRKYHNLPNPAVYAVEPEMDFPLEQTLLPVAKRVVVKFVTASPGKS
jgi:hypothetical protein